MRSLSPWVVVGLLLSGCGGDDPVDTVFSSGTAPTSSAAPVDEVVSSTLAPTTTLDRDASEPEPEPEPVTTTVPAAGPGPDQATLDTIAIAGQPVGTVEQAIALAFHPTSGTVLLAQRTGLIVDFTNAQVGATVLDLRDDLSLVGESGLLAMTYDPSATHLYVSFINAQNDSRIVAYPVDDRGVPTTGSPFVILEVDQPDIVHNGGHIAFGPDGSLRRRRWWCSSPAATALPRWISARAASSLMPEDSAATPPSRPAGPASLNLAKAESQSSSSLKKRPIAWPS